MERKEISWSLPSLSQSQNVSENSDSDYKKLKFLRVESDYNPIVAY